MSIIFKTLEKLKNDTGQKGAEQLRARKNKNVVSFDKIVSSLPWLSVIALLVFGIGAVTFYAIKDLAHSAAGNDNETVFPVSPPKLPGGVHPNENSTPPQKTANATSENAPPETWEGAKTTQALIGDKISAPGGMPPHQDKVNAVYLPPKRHASKKPQSAETWKPSAQQNIPELKTPIVPNSGNKAPHLEAVDADYLPPGRQARKNLPDQKLIEDQSPQYARPTTIFATAINKQDMKPPGNAKENFEQQSRLQDFRAVAIHEDASNPNHAGRPSRGSPYANLKYSGQAPLPSSSHETKMTSQHETMHRATVEKNSRICHLISEARRSLLSENDSRTESLLEELNACKGQDDVYVMKLRAFWHLKQGKYESAKSILALLLEKDENDLEAGINMAVLEIKTNQLNQAQTRLEKLRQIYAENTQIPSLLWKIRSSHTKNGF